MGWLDPAVGQVARQAKTGSCAGVPLWEWKVGPQTVLQVLLGLWSLHAAAAAAAVLAALAGLTVCCAARLSYCLQVACVPCQAAAADSI